VYPRARRGFNTKGWSLILFLGDIAVPREPLVRAAPPVHVLHPEPYEFAVANLEGALHHPSGAERDQAGLFNHPSIVDYLVQSRVRVLSLANNHVFDFGDPNAGTVTPLRNAGLFPVGLGSTLAEASAPAIVPSTHGEVVFMAFGWPVIGCRTATRSGAGVNPLEPGWLLSRLREVRTQVGDAARIVLLCHWNYELEVFPQPMHRQLAHAAVHNGADLVVGCHSHCAAGVEQVNGRWIVYGLGNWLLSSGEFLSGGLRYPARVDLQLTFGWDPVSLAGKCDWYRYEPASHQTRWLASDDPMACHRIAALTPFRNMSHEAYGVWFRRHRRKKRLLPVFYDIGTPRANRLKERWVDARHAAITMLRSVKLKGAHPRE
jgi:Bacterial capsule synthesis protein PGA_cap